jgi:tRNA (adenine22-N1)-methyltransferase
VEGAVIAGLGAETIIQALGEAGTSARARRLRWLVLQPQQEAWRLERWLEEAGLRVGVATWAVERRRLYRVLLARL